MKKLLIIGKKYKIVISVILVLLILLTSYFFIFSKRNSQTKQQLLTEVVKTGSIISTITASGQVETANYLAVTTSVSGIVNKVYVKEGDVVYKGQIILDVTLDSEGEISRANAYSSYLRAKNSLDSAKNSLLSLENSVIEKENSFDDVKESNSYQSEEERDEFKIAENNYLIAKNNIDLQNSSIKQLEISLNSAWEEYKSQSPVIYAPSDGTIANILAVEGIQIKNTVSTNERSTQTVASIKKQGTPIASLNISEIDINNVKVGQKVSLKLNSISNEQFMGMVVGIDKIGSISSGVSNYPVIIKFNKDSEKVLPNMGVEAEILIEQKDNVLIIPSSTITSIKGKKTVKRIVSGKTEIVEVQTGISDTNNTEVISGLSEGDIVIINALPTSGFNSQTQLRGASGFGAFTGGPR